MRSIWSIVEGHGEVQALPILMRRLAAEEEIYDLDLKPPIRLKRQRIPNTEHPDLENAIGLALLHGDMEGLVVVIDADGDCPVNLVDAIRKKLDDAAAHISCCVVIAKEEYEAWLLGGFSGFQDDSRVATGAAAPPDPDAETNPKAVLKALLVGSYSETVDQPGFTAKMDFDSARLRSRSFDKFSRDFKLLLESD